MFTLDDIKAAQTLVYEHMAPTPQYRWPLLDRRLEAEVWVKHENHTPTGAFKVRGGITFMDWLSKTRPGVAGVVTATRGNHGQSIARAATTLGLKAKIYVPHGNAREKNAAMRAFGGEVIEFGKDFDTARQEAERVALEEGLMLVPSFHSELVRGVSTYALELFTAVPDIETVYVPVGCGSGICSVITVRDLLGLKTEVVGVVSENATAVKQSFESGKMIETESADTFADGVAVRVPVPSAYEIYSKGASRIISVSDDAIADAVRIYYEDTHNLAEGAGAIPLAGLRSEIDHHKGKRVAVILCGGNIDQDVMQEILNGQTPKPR